MTIEQMRARLAEIAAQLEGISAGDAGFTEDQVTEIDTLQAEFDGLTKQLEAAEKLAAMKAKASAPTGRKTTGAEPAPRIQVGEPGNKRFGGFESSGAWLMAVKNAAKGTFDRRLQNLAQESVGEDGGFLVPEELSATILKKLGSDDSLMARCNTIPVSGNTLRIPTDESAPWSGGVRAYWVAEGQTITGSNNTFKQADFRLQKLAALVPATDELLEDSVALEGYINSAAPNAIMHEINAAIISGNGVGKPQGIINSGFAVTQAAEGGQSVDTVLAANVVKMYSRMFPQSRSNAVWVINPAVESELRLMKDPANNYIYLAPGSQANQTPYGTLLGRPIIPLMGGTPALGDVGDIMFVDFNMYTMIRKASGVKSATSIHLQFDKDITNFKFTLRVDGKSPYKSPVSTQYGSHQMSGFVLLAAR